MISRYLSALFLAWALMSCAHAGELSLPAVFSDHMVLQREQPVRIWGTAPRGEKVELHFGESRFETRADAEGGWRITLPTMKAGGPYKLTVRSGPHAKIFSDVFVGEVWLAAGQSNMAFRFRLSDPADQAATLRSLQGRNVRAFAVAKVVSGGKLLQKEDGPWGVAGVNSIADWSAVGVYFSEALRREKDVAIGIIDVSQGSSTIEAWMSEAALADAKAAGYVAEKPYEDIRRHYRNPTVLHRSMLTKVVPYGIRGVLWYQGESNASDAASYELLLPALIGNWRTLWERPDLPFLFAQLPAYEALDDETKQSWARFRAAQANVRAAVPGTGMAVLIDSGAKDNLHPADKKVVGERLSRLARALVYGEDIVHSGPVVKQVEYAKDLAVIHFDHAEGGLVAAGSVQGFEVRGRDGAWRQVVPLVDGHRVIARLPQGDEITGVRHAWANAPAVNLYNKAGLPAEPFSVERSADLEAGFANPPREARPLGWWHWINGNVTKAGIRADLEAAKRAGMGGVQMFDVEIYMPPGPVRYGTDRWFEHVRYAIETAHELGLEFHLMNTPGWSASGGPWVTPELSMKELIWSETSTRGGEISLKAPRPESKSKSSPRHPVDLEFYEDIAVIAVPQTAERIDEIERKIGAAARPVNRSPSRPAPGIPADAVIDLTAKMDDDGLLHATLPPGDWAILRFGYTTTGHGNHPAVPEGTGLEIDKLDAKAVAFQFQQAVGRIIEEAGPRAGDTFNGLLFDSFEAGFQTWTKQLPAEFSARKGYELAAWLPVLTGRIIESREQSEAVLWDFRHVIEELFAENYFGVMHRLAAEHGLKIYSESQGGPLNPLSANRHVDVPMNEFWMPDASPRAPLIKATVSAASLAGKRVVAAEAFTATPENGRYRNSLASLKRPGDQAFALGINRFALHSYTHQPVTDAAPGFALGRYGTHFGRLNTWWPYADGWVDYVSRSQFLLQQGRIVADVCFLIDEDLGYRIPSAATTKLPGYEFELCYPPVVREMTVRDGVLSHPSGAMFQLLVTPGAWLANTWVAELSTLRHLRNLVRAGAHLAGEPPVAPAGLNDALHKNEFDRLVEEIWGGLGSDVSSKQLGKGRVHAGSSLLDILGERNVPPDLSWSPSDANIKFIHRRTQDAEIYFVSSDASAPVRAELQFRQKDRRPEIWDALSGAHADAPTFSRTDEGISVPVQFGPQGAVFVVFRKPLPARWVSEASPAEPQLQAGRWLTHAESLSIGYSDGKTERVTLGRLPASEVVTGPWEVRFTDGRGAPDRAMLERLISWTDHPDPGIRYYSGTAIYETTFSASPRHQQQVAVLDLGEVADVARVFVNGAEVDVLWTPPFRVEITPFLREGRNTLAVHVANRWVNRLIGDAATDVDYTYQKPGTSKFTDGRIEVLPKWLSSRISGESSAPFAGKRHSFSVWKHYDADSPLVRSGLLGPVRIEWLWRIEPRH